jgi:DNA-binding response OmpR family regulator
MTQVSNTVVCVVDDNDDVNRLICATLRQAGFQTIAARDGAEGLRIVETMSVSLVVTDIVMPDREGLETIIELKERFPHVRILAISGAGDNGGADYLKLAMNLGADDCLAKPFSLASLVVKAVDMTRARL